jgi:tRNA-dihydrouridine synthase B
MNLLEDSEAQVAAVERFMDHLNEKMDRIPAAGAASGMREDTMEMTA